MKLLKADSYAFLFKQVSPSSLGLLRIAYGILMLWEFTHVREYMMGLVTHSKFFLTYDYFHWVKPVAPEMLEIGFVIATAAAVMQILGLFHKVSAFIVFVFWTYLFLLCRGHYTNHYYLFSIVGFWVWFTDSNRWASVDILLHKIPFFKPWILGVGDVTIIPFWQVLVFRVQLAIVYFYGGLAKFSLDWLSGYPMRIWLPMKPWLPEIMHQPWVAIAMSWGGMIFDLAVGIVLMTKYRRWALPFVVFFHTTNEMIFRTIGGFPHFMGAATLIFFDPSWPDELKAYLVAGKEGLAAFRKRMQVALPLPVLGRKKLVLGFLAIYFAWQTLYPFRHFLYAGDPSITGEGSVFAWRMMLTSRDYGAKFKVVVNGETFFITGKNFFEYMNFRQFTRLCRTPKAFQRFAYFIQDEMHKTNPALKPQIYGHLIVEYNGRPFSHVIDTSFNLLSTPYSQVRHIDWVRTAPFEEPPGSKYKNATPMKDASSDTLRVANAH